MSEPTDKAIKEAAPELLEVCIAMACWFKAEDETLGTFHDRMDLCSYAEFLTRRALAKVNGAMFNEEWTGVPQLILTIGSPEDNHD